MKGKQQQQQRKSPRRRRNNNGSTVARNQTKYHRQHVGFETTFNLNANSGVAMPIAAGNYNPGALPPTAHSAFFAQRFSPIWKAYRVLGWRATVIATAKTENNTNSGLISVVPFNQSAVPGFNITTTLAGLKPSSMLQLCELPNVKMLSISSASSRNRAGFSYFNGRRDINSLPFQAISETLPEYYITGLQLFHESDPEEGPIVIRIFGNLLVEFKDPAFFINPQVEQIDEEQQQQQQQQQQQSATVKRLRQFTFN